MEHHYIPRLYLRQFSACNNRRRICLYNFKNQRYIRDASIKHQACKPDFYGNRSLEKAISLIENDYSQCTQDIESANELPPVGSSQHQTLIRFIMLQRFRTPTAAQESNEMLEVGYKRMLKSLTEIEDKSVVDMVRIRQTKPVIANLMVVKDLSGFTDDLSFALLVNKSSKELITSDVPVVFYNQLFEYKSIQYGGSGIGAIGFQAVFPISPRLALMMFDADTYLIRSHNRIVALSNSDCENLNKLQIVNADVQTFFSQCISQQDIQQWVSRYGKYRTGVLTEFTSIQSQTEDQKLMRALTRKERFCRLKLSFFSFTNRAKRTRMYEGRVYLRPAIRSKYYNSL